MRRAFGADEWGDERPGEDLGRPLGLDSIARDVRRSFELEDGDVDLRDRPPPGALGATSGRTVALSPAGRGDSLTAKLIAAHELAHLRGAASEAAADRTAGAAVLGGRVPPSRGHSTALGLLRCNGTPPAKMTAEQRARAALDRFAGLSAVDREAFVASHYTSGSYAGVIRTHLEALPAEERVGRYRDTIRQLLQLVERQEVRASTGLTDAQMATRQAQFMDAEALAAARAASGSAAPTPAQQQQAHRQSVQQLNLPSRRVNRWAALPDVAARAAFRRRAARAVRLIVRRAATVAPELNIRATHLHFNPTAIDGASDTRYASYDRGHNRLNFGMDFTDAAMANPDYVMGTVVHEVFGHGEHGGIADSYSLELYQAARPQATRALSAAERGAPASSSERFGYGYQGTEIYSELREAQYDVRAPSGSGVRQGDRAARDIRRRVGLVKEKWEDTIARGLLRGMYARFALDPRITPVSLQLYVDAVDHHYPGENLLAPRP